MRRNPTVLGTAALVTAALALVGTLQDPIQKQEPTKGSRPKPPADAKPLPPVEEPFVASVDRRDLIQRFEPVRKYHGMYRLQSMVLPNGRTVLEARGYLVMGRKFLSIHLQAPGARAGVPMLRSGFRSYRVEGSKLVMTTEVGHFNNLDGEVSLEAQGLVQERTFSIVGSALRIEDGLGGWLDFVRIE